MTTISRIAARVALICTSFAAPLAFAGQLNLDNPDDAFSANRKIQCSTVDGEQVTYWWHGRAYSRRQGEKDKLLFNVEGMNTRQCTTVNDPEKGEGYHLVSREILLYKDPKTDEVLSKWENPWTGEVVDVLHVANDPVNFTSYKVGRFGPAKFFGTINGHRWWMTSTIPLWYPNVLGGDFQKQIGGTYHATEMFNFMGDLESLLDTDTNTADVQVGWVRMSDWLPWMMMDGREGVIYMHTAGRKIDSWEQMGDTMRAEIENHYPEYATPPPADDDRKNETSWSYYKKVAEGTITPPERD